MTEPSRVAALYLLRDDGAALLQHRDEKPWIPHAGIWVPPGGHCESGESMEACIRREFLEETAYRLGDVCHVTEFLDEHAEGFPPLWLAVFWSRYDGAQAPVCREGQALEFVLRDEAEARGVPGYLVALWDLSLEACRRLVPQS
jgi:8-oxo-dGTP pyrophosphatase MutT (NUDIX family)